MKTIALMLLVSLIPAAASAGIVDAAVVIDSSDAPVEGGGTSLFTKLDANIFIQSVDDQLNETSYKIPVSFRILSKGLHFVGVDRSGSRQAFTIRGLSGHPIKDIFEPYVGGLVQVGLIFNFDYFIARNDRGIWLENRSAWTAAMGAAASKIKIVLATDPKDTEVQVNTKGGTTERKTVTLQSIQDQTIQ
jgi:hypothetical protein